MLELPNRDYSCVKNPYYIVVLHNISLCYFFLFYFFSSISFFKPKTHRIEKNQRAKCRTYELPNTKSDLHVLILVYSINSKTFNKMHSRAVSFVSHCGLCIVVDFVSVFFLHRRCYCWHLVWCAVYSRYLTNLFQ